MQETEDFTAPPPRPLHIPELLAPAGGRAQFFAALNSGADAVFLGLKEFNARARAENFTVEDLQELVPLAHRYGMKVLVTLNILIKDLELDKLLEQLSSLSRLAVDAIIVQDLGVARLVTNYFPNLRLHASTQLAVHNVHGVRQAIDAGFRRVVLARELTAVEMKRIRDAIPRDQIEIEAFCHGSLCYSYSGLCFFSGADNARSGNRGECAYTCREPYKIISEPGQGFLFSMRDLDTADHLEKFVAAGLDTLKIEGRKKDAQFVSSVVKLYRQKLDEAFGVKTLRASAPPAAQRFFQSAHKDSDLREDLSLSFARRPTSFFLLNRYKENVIDLDNPSHAGIHLGSVTALRTDQKHEVWIRVKLAAALERFDGLSLRPAAKVSHALPQDGHDNKASLGKMMDRYDRDECEFSARDIQIKGRRVTQADAGSEVDILVPALNKKALSVGMDVRKIRSSLLKAKVEALTQAPPDRRLRVEISFGMKATITAVNNGHIRIDAEVSCGGAPARLSLCFPTLTDSHPMAWQTQLEKELELIGPRPGDACPYYFVCDSMQVSAEPSAVVARSDLKQLKVALRQLLIRLYDKQNDAIIDRCRLDWSSRSAPVMPRQASPYLSIKLDDLTYLGYMADLCAQHANVAKALREVVFEPKRGPMPVADMMKVLIDFCADRDLRLRLAIPTVIRAWDEPWLKQWIKSANANAIYSYELGNIGAKAFLEACDVPLPRCNFTADFSFYTLNREAVAFAADHGVSLAALSIEDDYQSLRHLLRHWPKEAPIRPQVILYKDTPLFIAEACSLTALHNGCPTAKVCGYRTLEVENKQGERFFVGHEGCKSVVYGKQAYAISQFKHKLLEHGVRDFRVDFLTRPYSRSAFQAVFLSCINGEAIPGTHSANFNRELL